jgi:hypothetical protein
MSASDDGHAPANRRLPSVDQLQGGAEPSEHTTVVCVPEGTITVVEGAGDAGRLLLTQPASAMTRSAPDRMFMKAPQWRR